MLVIVAVLAGCGDDASAVDAAVDSTDAPNAIGVVFINEVMPSNTAACADPFGEFDDWVELYNSGDVDIDLGGYFVTDDMQQPTRVKLSAGLTVPAHGFLLLWADDQIQGLDHLSFKLEANGEAFMLSAPDGTVVDTVEFGAATTDVSFARLPDGTGALVGCATSTCGTSNGSSCGTVP